MKKTISKARLNLLLRMIGEDFTFWTRTKKRGLVGRATDIWEGSHCVKCEEIIGTDEWMISLYHYGKYHLTCADFSLEKSFVLCHGAEFNISNITENLLKILDGYEITNEES